MSAAGPNGAASAEGAEGVRASVAFCGDFERLTRAASEYLIVHHSALASVLDKDEAVLRFCGSLRAEPQAVAALLEELAERVDHETARRAHRANVARGAPEPSSSPDLGAFVDQMMAVAMAIARGADKARDRAAFLHMASLGADLLKERMKGAHGDGSAAAEYVGDFAERMFGRCVAAVEAVHEGGP